MLSKLIAHLLRILELKETPVYMWTDSAVAYTWINNHPSRWKDFVQNRVCYIQETLPQAIWKFIPGTDNPADCASRGLTPSQLSERTTWWTGPAWFRQDSSIWPHAQQLPSHKDNLEEKPTRISVLTSVKAPEPWNLLDRYSNLIKLLRITAWCKRAISRFKKSSDLPIGPITTQELEAVKFYWIKVTQQLSFQ